MSSTATTNIITRFIHSLMENGNDRRDQAEKHLKDTLEKSKEMIENWHQPTKTRGFWRRDLNQGTYVTSQEPQLRGGVGRRTNWG